MRKYAAFILCLALISGLLTGCRRAQYAENQAYAVMLGIDISEDESIELIVKYPKLAGGSGGSSGGGGGSSYATATASGTSFQAALNDLKIKVPGEINLSALTMVVVSEALLASEKFPVVLDEFVANYRMYSAAYIAASTSKASDVIDNYEPQIGSRLSEALRSHIENEEKLGNIPGSRLADVYYRLDSIYSAPLIMKCSTIEKAGEENDKKSVTYSGAYAIKAGNEILAFDTGETKLINLLTGDLKQISYSKGARSADLAIDSGPKIKITTGNEPEITIRLKLSGITIGEKGEMSAVADEIKADIYAVIEKCREYRVEPFGLADKAAVKFITIDDWLEYDWTERFANSDIKVDIEIAEVF